MRSLLPNKDKTMENLSSSIVMGQFSNFGPNYHQARSLIFQKYNRASALVTNGTAAIELACKTMLYAGCRVVIPDYTHFGTYSGVVNARCRPILARVNKKTWALDLEGLAKRKDEFDAMVVVAPFGYHLDIEPYEEFAAKHDKMIIYDFAGAWGQFPETDFPVCYSFHATKSLSTGEGGAILFKAFTYAEKARKLSNFGIENDGKILMNHGGNYKLDEIRCAMLVAHLDNEVEFWERNSKRKFTLERYMRHFKILSNKKFRKAIPSMAALPNMTKLRIEALPPFITAKRYYPLLSRMPCLNRVPRFSESDKYFENIVALPIDVTVEEQDYIIKEIRKAKIAPFKFT